MRARLALFGLSAVLIAALFVPVLSAMPRFGAHPLPYGEAINAAGPAERHVTNMVSAINFDYRGFDTLGEEFMLLSAVTGTAMLLRGQRGADSLDRPARTGTRPIPPRSEALVLISRLIAPLTVLFGMYVVLHAMLTPGGGFQGGVIVASGALLLYLGDGYRVWRRLLRAPWIDAAEGGGAALYALAGFWPMLHGHAYLENTLPVGTLHGLLSGGLMLVLNLGVGFAVAGGFLMLFTEFLEETRAAKGAT